MTAAGAARVLEQVEPGPARPADDAVGAATDRTLAGHAREGQHEVGARIERGAAELRPAPGGAYRSAAHITCRSGDRPNQRSNAATPCSTSIVSPSSARKPASRAASTHGVPPGR